MVINNAVCTLVLDSKRTNRRTGKLKAYLLYILYILYIVYQIDRLIDWNKHKQAANYMPIYYLELI